MTFKEPDQPALQFLLRDGLKGVAEREERDVRPRVFDDVGVHLLTLGGVARGVGRTNRNPQRGEGGRCRCCHREDMAGEQHPLLAAHQNAVHQQLELHYFHVVTRRCPHLVRPVDDHDGGRDGDGRRRREVGAERDVSTVTAALIRCVTHAGRDDVVSEPLAGHPQLRGRLESSIGRVGRRQRAHDGARVALFEPHLPMHGVIDPDGEGCPVDADVEAGVTHADRRWWVEDQGAAGRRDLPLSVRVLLQEGKRRTVSLRAGHHTHSWPHHHMRARDGEQLRRLRLREKLAPHMRLAASQFEEEALVRRDDREVGSASEPYELESSVGGVCGRRAHCQQRRTEPDVIERRHPHALSLPLGPLGSVRGLQQRHVWRCVWRQHACQRGLARPSCGIGEGAGEHDQTVGVGCQARHRDLHRLGHGAVPRHRLAEALCTVLPEAQVRQRSVIAAVGAQGDGGAFDAGVPGGGAFQHQLQARGLCVDERRDVHRQPRRRCVARAILDLQLKGVVSRRRRAEVDVSEPGRVVPLLRDDRTRLRGVRHLRLLESAVEGVQLNTGVETGESCSCLRDPDVVFTLDLQCQPATAPEVDTSIACRGGRD